MKDNKKNSKKQVLVENLSTDEYTGEEREPAPTGTYTKSIILQHLVTGFDYFRQGMDEIANAYMLMKMVDPDLHRKISKFGENMSKMINGLGKLIEQQGGSIERVTKSEALKKYFGEKGMSALGMNESKEDIFNTRVELQIERIKDIISKTKRI